jgi:hypothetical protein
MTDSANDWDIRLQSFLYDGFNRLSRDPRKGRDIHSGYLRGCGLRFGNIGELCLADPVFTKALELARATAPDGQPRTVVSELNLANIFAIMKINLTMNPIAGHIVEYGSYRGGAAIFMAYAAKLLLPGVRVIGFDTFAGLPLTDPAVDVYEQGAFDKVDLEELRRHVASIGLDNLTFVEGKFDDTLPGALPTIGQVCLAHIDCDIYDSVVSTYELTKPYLAPGAYLVFDDPLVPTCIGAFEAVEELLVRRDGLHAEQIFPHLVYRAP